MTDGAHEWSDATEGISQSDSSARVPYDSSPADGAPSADDFFQGDLPTADSTDGAAGGSPDDGDPPTGEIPSADALLRAILGKEYDVARKLPLAGASVFVRSIRRTETGSELSFWIRESTLTPPGGRSPKDYLGELLRSSSLTVFLYDEESANAPLWLSVEIGEDVQQKNGGLSFTVRIKGTYLQAQNSYFVALRIAEGKTLRGAAGAWYIPESAAALPAPPA